MLLLSLLACAPQHWEINGCQYTVEQPELGWEEAGELAGLPARRLAGGQGRLEAAPRVVGEGDGLRLILGWQRGDGQALAALGPGGEALAGLRLDSPSCWLDVEDANGDDVLLRVRRAEAGPPQRSPLEEALAWSLGSGQLRSLPWSDPGATSHALQLHPAGLLLRTAPERSLGLWTEGGLQRLAGPEGAPRGRPLRLGAELLWSDGQRLHSWSAERGPQELGPGRDPGTDGRQLVWTDAEGRIRLAALDRLEEARDLGPAQSKLGLAPFVVGSGWAAQALGAGEIGLIQLDSGERRRLSAQGALAPLHIADGWLYLRAWAPEGLLALRLP